MKIAGLDIGTTGCKCTVFDEKGNYLDKAYHNYPVKRQLDGHEIDVSLVMEAVYAVIREMTMCFPDIAGIGVTSFGETFVMTDEEGNPLHTSMLYTDPRGQEELSELVKNVGEKNLAEITGLRPHEMYSIAKIMWMKHHQPEIYKEAKHIFLMEDYVVYHLTKHAQIDYSLATRTMAFDIRTLNWSSKIFEAADIDVSLMSEVVPTGTVAGCVTTEAAEKTGLMYETKVVSVSHDQVAAAVGAGVFDGDIAVDGAGTVQCLTPIYDELPDIDVMYQGYYSVVPYVIPGKYVAYAFSYTGGALMQWCVDTIAQKEEVLAGLQGMSVNEYLEQEYAQMHQEEPSGLLVLPHFAGAATPYMDSGSKGAILGLTTETSVAEIYHGCMEGVVYEMYLNLLKLQESGIHFTKMSATGGGAHSKMWMQMKADMLNVPITALKTVDAGTVGCAMMTGMAIGLFENLKDATAHMVEETVTYEPRPKMHDKYKRVFERYRQLYDKVRPLM